MHMKHRALSAMAATESGQGNGLYAGPRYPRVLPDGPGTRTIEWNQYQRTTGVPVVPVPSAGPDSLFPTESPGVAFYEIRAGLPPAAMFIAIAPSGRSAVYQAVGPEGIRFSAAELVGMDPVLRPDENTAPPGYGDPEPEPPPGPACVFDGGASFYFDPRDYARSGEPGFRPQFPAVQGPNTGDPDSPPSVTPRLPGGGGDTPGYRAGTPGNPYRPWKDPTSQFYGCATSGEVVEPRLPPTWDPWAPIPPVVTPSEPDPADDGGDGDGEPEPEPIPCWDGRTNQTGFIDPTTGDCVPSGNGGGPGNGGGGPGNGGGGPGNGGGGPGNGGGGPGNGSGGPGNGGGGAPSGDGSRFVAWFAALLVGIAIRNRNR